MPPAPGGYPAAPSVAMPNAPSAVQPTYSQVSDNINIVMLVFFIYLCQIVHIDRLKVWFLHCQQTENNTQTSWCFFFNADDSIATDV
jgi:hypothetical protein